jgi:hypothetical protein
MANIMTKILIEKITQQAEYLTVNYSNAWFQEDIELLTQLVFSSLTSIKVQEKIIGADRENIRFNWQAHYFVLNFDCCSQSCWLEGQDNASADYLDKVYWALIK